MYKVIFDEGIHLRGTDIWFDAKKKVNQTFISNANISTIPRHDRIIATPETLRLIENRTRNSIVLSCPYNRPFTLGKAKVELVPSGYALGAAQILVELNGKRIVYTGDFKLRYSSTSKYIELRRCDTLVMKCRYALPKYLFPSDDEIVEKIYEFVKESLYFGYTPIIFVDILGKVQDLIQCLGIRKLILSVHRKIFKTLEVYKEFGSDFINCESFNPKKIKGKVLIFPTHMRGSELIDKIEKKRTCVVMGLAVENELLVKSAFKVDETFPLSSHAGYDELIQYVETVKPKEIFLIEGFCVEFANKLKDMGYNAKPIETPVQLKLI